MRIKNKEIRQRRHRKEQKIKDAQRELRVQYGDKKPAAPVEKAPAPKKAAPKKATEAAATAEKKPAKKPAAKKPEPKKAPPKEETEPATE